MIKSLVFLTMGFICFFTSQVYACDDTLVMLLTSQNPTGEFAKSIKSFMSTLTVLGSSLKYRTSSDYNKELKNVMESWMNFAQKYMVNPPPEASNDLKWVDKMHKASGLLGEIRKYVLNKEYMTAHDRVLAFSSHIDTFFESMGVSPEKQLFIKTSGCVIKLRRMVLSENYLSASEAMDELKNLTSEFKLLIPDENDANSLYKNVTIIESQISSIIKNKESLKNVDDQIDKLQALFDKLRSVILMKEWFTD